MPGRITSTHRNCRQRLARLTLLALVGAAVQTASLPVRATDTAVKGDAEAGKDVFRRCRSCHTVGPGARNRLGPLLNDLIGRKAGTVPGYAYSPAMNAAGAKGLVWTERVLLDYFARPGRYVKDSKMIFSGLPEEEDRIDLLAYLKTFSNVTRK